MLYAMADNGINIPAARDGALYSFLTGGQDYIFGGIGDEFEITVSSSSYIVTLTEGEGICGGRHIREVTENSANSTIQLGANASGYVTIRIDLSRPSGTECYLCATPTLVSQDINSTGTVRDLPLYQYATDGNGISTWTDIRHVSSGSNVVNYMSGGKCYVQYFENNVLKTKQIGSLDPSNLTATPGDVKSGKTFGGANSDDPQTGTFAAQSKTATPSTAEQTISPDEGKYLSSVVVKKATSNSVSKWQTASDVDNFTGYLSLDTLTSGTNKYFYAGAYNGQVVVQGSTDNSQWYDITSKWSPGSNQADGNKPGRIATVSGTNSTYRYFRVHRNGYNNGGSGGAFLIVVG